MNKPRALTPNASTTLRERFPIERHIFTDREREDFLNRVTGKQFAIYTCNARNVKLIRSMYHWTKTRWSSLRIVSRMYVKYDHIVVWLESV